MTFAAAATAGPVAAPAAAVPVVAVVAVAAAGLLVAPALRGLVVRRAVPQGEPPRTACPECARTVRGLPPNGRCPGCRERLGPAPGVVEALTVAVFAALAARTQLALWPAALWTAALGVVLGLTDARVRRLPYPLTAALAAGLAPLLAVAALLDGRPGVLVRCLLVALAAGVLFELPAWFGLMGGGDSPLALSLGALLGWYGWGAALSGLFAACLLAGLWGSGRALVALVRRERVRGLELPAGPFLLLGALAAVLVQA
ncbi:prepilin peptidase [Kitasatospora sp. NPDC004240]